MTISIVKEPDNMAKLCWNVVKSCHFCDAPTKYRHKETNKPVCPDCADQHDVFDLFSSESPENYLTEA